MNLSTEANSIYWKGKGKALHEVLIRMSGMQDWAAGDEIESWVNALGDELDSPECAALMASKPKETVEFLGWLKSPVALRILDAIDELEHGAAARLVLEAEQMRENPVFRLFIESLDILARSRLLAHVFSPDRMRLVEAAVMTVRAKN